MSLSPRTAARLRTCNPRGQLTEVIDALGQSTRYGYDEQGNKLTQTDAEGRVTRWEYDAAGRQVSRTLPMGQRERFAYDALGNRIRHVDFNGATTEYRYDVNDREIERTYLDEGTTVTTTYTDSGQVDTVTDAEGTTDRDFSQRYRVLQSSTLVKATKGHHEGHAEGPQKDLRRTSEGPRRTSRTTSRRT